MVSDETRIDARKGRLLVLFQSDIFNLRLNEIQKLYDAAHVTNEMLVEQLHKHCAPITGFDKAIYTDMAYILISEIIENVEIESVFNAQYLLRYPSIYNEIEKIESMLQIDKDKGFKEFQKILGEHLSLGEDVVKKTDFCLFVYLLYSSDLIWNANILDDKITISDARIWRDRQLNHLEYTVNDNRIVFDDTEELVFNSKMFEKLVNKCRSDLSEYLGIPESKLNKHILSQLSLETRHEDLTHVINPGIPGYTNASSHHVVQENHGTVTWLATITAPRSIRQGALGYQPDVENLIRLYCRGRVDSVWAEKISQDEPFLKTTFLRDCKSKSPAEDYQAICYLYNIDIVYQMYKVMQERFYENFSWEQVTHKNRLERSDAVVSELRRIIHNKEITIQSLTREKSLLNDSLRKKGDAEAIQLVQKEQKLYKELEDKEAEIAELKEQLRNQNEFIELLKAPADDLSDDDSELNVSSLQGRKYLFVGYAEEAFPELKKQFPDSVFMYNDSVSITGIKVDAIIYLIRYMSHAMMYRVKAKSQLQDLPAVYCNGRSLNSVYTDMQALEFNE